MGIEKLDPMIDRKELARLWSVTEEWIATCVKFHGLPAYKFGRLVRFDLKEVSAWKRERKLNG